MDTFLIAFPSILVKIRSFLKSQAQKGDPQPGLNLLGLFQNFEPEPSKKNPDSWLGLGPNPSLSKFWKHTQ